MGEVVKVTRVGVLSADAAVEAFGRDHQAFAVPETGPAVPAPAPASGAAAEGRWSSLAGVASALARIAPDTAVQIALDGTWRALTDLGETCRGAQFVPGGSQVPLTSFETVRIDTSARSATSRKAALVERSLLVGRGGENYRAVAIASLK